jgi:hypothetical protein
MIKKKILITGSNSGLGKYLVKAYKCYALDRKKNINLRIILYLRLDSLI